MDRRISACTGPGRTARFVVHRLGLVPAAMMMFAPGQSVAQDDPIGCDDGAATCTIADRVIYLPEFFAQYNPVTAYDMVQRVPGFSIDSGEEVRGFGGGAGNVLIDGQRPSTKSSDIGQTLSRIGAGNVERIELIRAGAGALDVAGQSVVVNVVQQAGGAGNSSPWSFSVWKRTPDGGVRPFGNMSYSGEAAGLKYTFGANFFASSMLIHTREEITRFAGADEIRVGDGSYRGQEGGLSLNLEKGFANGDTARLNLEGAISGSKDIFTETRLLSSGGVDVAFFPTPDKQHSYEIGGDYEHAFTPAFDVKLIGLFKKSFSNTEYGFVFTPETGPGDRSLFISDKNSGEKIARTEFNFRGLPGHAIQFGGEIAHNYTQGAAEFFVDDGAGGLQPETIDGANTRVSELRGEPFIKDTWTVSQWLTVDAGMAVELSRIAQSGDAENSRFFVYPKPSLAFTYDLDTKNQFRLSMRREVNQLSFDQFISAVNFQDEDVDFGNPDLQPQRTWVLETSYERRFGSIGVARLTGFYKYINDVEDLLPVGGIVEVPGNIGAGEIVGGELKLTLPLSAIMLENAQFNTTATLQDSSVTDPVTGAVRKISGLFDKNVSMEFRQDFPARKVSWGASYALLKPQRYYGLDEITINTQEDADIAIYVETTAIKGLKVKLVANDILNVVNSRDRTVYAGSRALDTPLFREVRRHQNGGGVALTVSGTF